MKHWRSVWLKWSGADGSETAKLLGVKGASTWCEGPRMMPSPKNKDLMFLPILARIA